MNKLFLIIQREYLYRVKKKSFFLLTLLMPLLMSGIACLPFLLGQIQDDGLKKIVIIDHTEQYAPLFQSNSTYAFDYDRTLSPQVAASQPGVEAVVAITAPLADHPDSLFIYSESNVKPELLTFVKFTLEEQVRKERLAKHHIANIDTIIAESERPLIPTTLKCGTEGAAITNTTASVGIGMFFSFLIYLFVILYGNIVMQSAIEEKTNRIVEIIISSVKPFQLMMGKIIGIGLVGLTQFLLWSLLLLGGFALLNLFFGSSETAATVAGSLASQGAAAANDLPQATLLFNEFSHSLSGIPFVEVILMFLLYFVGGYFLYASFFAAAGASVNEQQDAAQFQTPMLLVIIFALYASMASAQNPDGPLAFWASLFPLTSPIVMMVRIPFSVPLWQELLSLAILYGTALGFVWLSGRIYRVGILMYGKKPTFKDLFKWITY